MSMSQTHDHLPVPIDMERIAAFCKRWGFRELSLFGSVLRDDFGPGSDVDVLVSLSDGSQWGYWNWPETVDELESIFGRRVDLVFEEAMKNPFRRREILSTREVLHAA